MSDSSSITSEKQQNSPRKLWPWVITAVVALLAAIFLTAWIPQEQGEDLLERIEAAGGFYSINTADRPEAGSFLDDYEYVELFDQVESLTLPYVDAELFRDCVVAFKSLESFEFDLANSVDFDRETASRLSELELLRVSDYAEAGVENPNFEFLAGCQSVKQLELESEYLDDGFWHYLPEMKSLTHLELMVGARVGGEGIPDLSDSKLESILIRSYGSEREFRNFTQLLTAPDLKELEIIGVSIVDLQPVTISAAPSLEVLVLGDAELTDDILPILENCKSLDFLDLGHNRISGGSLDRISLLSLQTLILSNNPLTAEACRDLSAFSSLLDLRVSKAGLQTDWLTCWSESPLAGKLKVLALADNEIGDDVIAVLQSFSRLEQLYVQETILTEAGILKLADHPSLNYLMVDGKVSDETFELFLKKVTERGGDIQFARARSVEIQGLPVTSEMIDSPTNDE